VARITRGEFLSLGAALAGAGIFGKVGRAQQPTARPDLLLINANIYTMDSAMPRAQALAVAGGRFVAIGSNADIANLKTAAVTVIDAAGGTVVPGFIDCHCHPSGVQELFGVNCDVRTVKAIQDAVRARAKETPPEFWITGFMFDDTKLADGPLHRRHLDEVTRDHPVAIAHRGGHTAWYNTKALELAGVTKATPDPEHGRFFRDESGELTGRVAEEARTVFGRVGRREQFTAAQQRDRARQGMRHISQLLTAAGLTSVHDAGSGREKLTAYEDARANGELRHRAYFLIRGRAMVDAMKAAGMKTGSGDEWIRIGGVKYGADGSASERTMRMSTPYVGTNDYGLLTMTQKEIDDGVEDCHRNGFQVCIHANGDVTIDMVLRAYERVLKEWPVPDRRHRIEHCSLINPDLLRRIKATGSIPTPFWTYVYYHGEKWSAYGEEKMRSMFAHRSFLDAGITVVGASDYMPGPFAPLMAIQSMVTRTDYKGRTWGASQKVSVDEALRIGTINGAHASYEERFKGSITAGKLADFVILENDPHRVAPDTIKDIRIARTVVGGKTMYAP
jgi:predicted amidohydrolase YtcJ